MLTNLVALIAVATFGQSDGFTQKTIAQAYAQAVPATCVISYTAEVNNPGTGQTAKREGSAFGLVVSASGLVMAPGHMSYENAEASNITVEVDQGDRRCEYSARLLSKPEDINVCFLQLESDKKLSLPHVRFTQSGLNLGDPILMIGVLGDSLDNTRAVATSRVAAVLEKPRTTYCLDSSMKIGFIGGPVFDASGHAVGVVGFDLTNSEGGDMYTRSGHPLLYQASLFQKYINAPPDENAGSAADAWLGVFGQPLTDDFAEYWNLEKDGGLIVSTVIPGSPADTAGITSGDVIRRFNGVDVRPKVDAEVIGFTRLVRDTGIGKTVHVELLRNGEPMKAEVTLVARPKPARDASEYTDDVLGMTVRELTADVRILLNLSEDVNGVIVRRVRSGGAAALAGMKPGIIILRLGDKAISSLEEYQDAMKNLAQQRPGEITAFCRAGAATGFLRIEPNWGEPAPKTESAIAN